MNRKVKGHFTVGVASAVYALMAPAALPALAQDARPVGFAIVHGATGPVVRDGADRRVIVGKPATWGIRYYCYMNGEYVDDVVTPQMSGQPTTGNPKPPKFKPATVHTNPPTGETTQLTIDTTTTTRPDNYPLTVWGTGSKCSYYSPFYPNLQVAPKVIGPNEVWWFKNNDPAGYNTKITLFALADGFGPYTWTITDGANFAEFGNKSATQTTNANEVKVKGVKGSKKLNDVKVTVMVNSVTSDPYKLTVKQPKSLGPLAVNHISDPTWAYESDIHYSILDQFAKILPANVPLNEHFTTAVTADFVGMDWRRGANGGATVDPNDWYDQVQGEVAAHTPIPQHPHAPLGNVMVYHWDGEWSIGSADPSGGKGVKVQTNTWQKFRDHAVHTNIVSPP